MQNLLRWLFKISDTGHPTIKQQPTPPVGKQKRRARGTANKEYQMQKWRDKADK